MTRLPGRPALLAIAALIAACGSSSAASNASRGSGSAGSGSAAAARCGPSGTRTLAAGSEVRVYAQRGNVYGCSARTGRRTLLGQTRSICIGRQVVSPIAVAGELAAYGIESCGVDTGLAEVIVRRLSDGRILLDDPAVASLLGPESYRNVASVVVKSDGAVAWIGVGSSIISHRLTIEVHRVDRTGARLLDTGASIDQHSLRLVNGQVSWRDGGAVRSVPLR